MSIRVMADVYDFGPDDPVDCAVLLALASHANDDGRSCYPSLERVARMARCSRRTVIRAVESLEAGDWLSVKRGRGRGHMSEYTIHTEKLKRCHRVTFSEPAEKIEKVTLTTVKGDSHDIPPAPPNRKNRQETSIKNNTPLPPSQASGERRDETEWAADRVMRECSFADAKLLPVIEKAILLELPRGEPGVTAALMIANWREYSSLGEFLRYTWGPRKFFAQGFWQNPRLWPLDQKRLDQVRRL